MSRKNIAKTDTISNNLYESASLNLRRLRRGRKSLAATANIKVEVQKLFKAAELGNANAMYEIGLYFDQYSLFGKNNKKHFWWICRAARNGNILACNSVALCYERGIGTKKSNKKALYWYQRGARLGDPLAMYNLGRSYHRGDIVNQNLNLALKWYKKSIAPGYINGWMRIGEIELSLKRPNFDKIFKCFNKVLKSKYGDEEVMSLLAKAYAKRGQVKNAKYWNDKYNTWFNE